MKWYSFDMTFASFEWIQYMRRSQLTISVIPLSSYIF
jgi:hypothetical protein